MYQIYIHKKAIDFPKPHTNYNSFHVAFREMLSGPRCCEVTMWRDGDNDGGMVFSIPKSS